MYMTLVSGWFLGHPPGTEMLLPVLKGYSDRKNDFICENGAVYSESGFTGGSNQERIHLQYRRPRFNPWVRKIPGEGNGNPLQYSCLENPMDRRAWWATVHAWGRKESGTTD